ncbi:Pho80p cyclin [Lecanora helva]
MLLISTNHTRGLRPSGIKKGRHAPPQARHYYSSTTHTWRNPYSARESCYSDFVPCTYDEQTLLSRLYKYARDFLAQTNGTILQRNLTCREDSGSSGHPPSDIEMITSSPSPTLHASTTTCSPRSYDGSYRLSSAPSPRPYIKPPPRAAIARQVSQSPTVRPNPNKRPLSTTTAPKTTVDTGTQYSPPQHPMSTTLDPPKSTGMRKETPSPPQPPPEPALEPQMPPKRPAVAQPTAQPGSASSTTLAQSSSSSSHGSSPKRARPSKPAVKIMPAEYENCDVQDLVNLISNMLLELIRHNDEIPLKDGHLTRFHSRAPPGISVKDYLQRLTTHATLSPPILLSMVYYIDRLCALYPAFTISSLTVHRFLITSATVASKGLSDSFWTNNTYAKVGGVSLKELALLELEFLWRVEWRIVPKPEVLVEYYRSLVGRSEGFKVEGESSSSSIRESSEEEMDVSDAREESEKGKGKSKE